MAAAYLPVTEKVPDRNRLESFALVKSLDIGYDSSMWWNLNQKTIAKTIAAWLILIMFMIMGLYIVFC